MRSKPDGFGLTNYETDCGRNALIEIVVTGMFL